MQFILLTITSFTHRRRGSGLWCYPSQQRFQSMIKWPVVLPGCSDVARSRGPHQFARIAGNQARTDESSRMTRSIAKPQVFAFICLQRSSRSNMQQLCSIKSRNDVRTQTSQAGFRSSWFHHTRGVAAIGYEPIRRRNLTKVTPRRPPDTSVAAAFRRYWDEGSDRHLSIPTTRRASVVFEESDDRRARQIMG